MEHRTFRATVTWALGTLNRIVHKAGDLTIVTAADRTHERSLLNLLGSIARREPNTHVVVYDLGMTDDGLERIASRFPYVVRTFDYSAYPPYFHITKNAGEYAWKAPMVKEVADEFGGLVCWMDAGNVVRYPLFRLRRLAYRRGYFSQTSTGTIKDWTHPGMLAFFGLPPDWKKNERNLNAACVIFDTRHARARTLLNDWAKYSHYKECIAPVGSSRANHRQDQALFTVLAYRSAEMPIPRYRHPEFLIQQDADEDA